jgi:ketosteroid isomerase-like protein
MLRRAAAPQPSLITTRMISEAAAGRGRLRRRSAGWRASGPILWRKRQPLLLRGLRPPSNGQGDANFSARDATAVPMRLRPHGYFGKISPLGCELRFASRASHARNFLPIDHGEIPSTMERAVRVGRNTGGEKTLVEHLNRQRVVNLLEAFYAGDIEGALARLSDDIEYVAAAPIDILPHLGHRQGKAQIRQMWQIVHSRYSSMRYELPFIVAEGDKVATLIRVFFTKRGTDRIVQFDIAVFYSFRDGRVTQIREVIDSFDLVQQVLERDIAAVLADTRPGKA